MNMDSFQATTSASFCHTSQKLVSPEYWETDVTSWVIWSGLTGWRLSLAAELHGVQSRRLVANKGSLNTSSPTALQFIKRWKSLETSACSFFGASSHCGCVDMKLNSFSFFEFEARQEQSVHCWFCWMTADHDQLESVANEPVTACASL